MPELEIASYDANPNPPTMAAEPPVTMTLEEAFAFFNERLWEGKLPPVVLLVHRKQKPTTCGYYSPGRWRARGDETLRATEEEMRERDAELWKQNASEDETFLGNPNGWELAEIALNPERWPYDSDREILSTLVHEIAHHWQEYFGKKKARKGYHNREWGTEMKRIGLYPSNTGKPEGAETGVQMTHYIVEGGPFDKLCDELLAGGVRIKWEAPKPRRLPKPKSKVKYTCPTCAANAWAKPASSLLCGKCREAMESEGEG